jgi:hypothetical protein
MVLFSETLSRLSTTAENARYLESIEILLTRLVQSRTRTTTFPKCC